MYLLDANVFIEAKNFYYRFDIFPAFWEWLDEEQQKGNIASIIPICEELSKGNDELSDWAKQRRGTDWFSPVDDNDTQMNFSGIAQWAMVEDFTDSAKSDFLSVADSWLVAKTKSINATVVTHESFDPNIKRRIKIPNACKAFDVPYINTFDLLHRLGAKF